MTTEEFRAQFPELSAEVYGKPLVYLDNAATSQRPSAVIDKWTEMSSHLNANIHRAVHRTASLATDEFESAREAVRAFIGAPRKEEVIFTSGATAALNLAAYCIGEAFVKEGDEVVIAECEHHSDIVPWQLMCSRKGATVKVLPVDGDGRLEIGRLDALIGPRTRAVCIAHVSNVLGLVNPVEEAAAVCHAKGCLLVVDGAQGIVHTKVDVQALGCDFYAFSGHKMYAAPGTGVLWGRKEVLEQLPPYMGGGEMIGHVSFGGSTWAPLPGKFEAGTQNIAGVPTFKPAIDTMRQAEDPLIAAGLRDVRDFMLEELRKDDRVRLFGVPQRPEEKIPLFSFAVRGAHHEDLALILDKMGIAVRSGQMCAEPLMDKYGVTGMLRASFAPYNTLAEAECFIKSLQKAVNMLI